jgi:hypothetical protein
MRESPELIALVERMYAAEIRDRWLVQGHSLGVPNADSFGLELPR